MMYPLLVIANVYPLNPSWNINSNWNYISQLLMLFFDAIFSKDCGSSNSTQLHYKFSKCFFFVIPKISPAIFWTLNLLRMLF